MPINTKKYIEKHLKIRNKRAQIIPLILNGPQQKLYDALKAQHDAGKPMRAMVLKARQMGFSTLVEAIIFKGAATTFDSKAGIVAHKAEATANLYKMSKLFYDRLPEEIKPIREARNAQELVFGDTRSTIKCMTAAGEGIGRSDTFQRLHISEYAFWKGDKKETLLGLLQAVPNDPGTLVIIESTANGFEDFKTRWDQAEKGESEFAAVFCAWWELPEYSMAYTGFELDESEQKLKETYGLTLDQLEWRRWCIRNNCGGDAELFRQEYPSNPYEAFISTGQCIFDKEAIIGRLATIRPPIKTGIFEYEINGAEITNIKWKDDKKGPIQIYKERKDNYPYVIGGDTAGDGSDFFAGEVLDNTTGEQVASLRHQFDEDLYAYQMYCMGMHYNNALIGIEVNFSPYPVKELTRLGYGHQYIREYPDTYTGKRQKRYGFKTTKQTRPEILVELTTVARDSVYLINDKTTLEEMLTFVKDEKGHAAAQQDAHDDTVIALAIAYRIRNQQSYKPETKAVHDDDYTPFEDQLQAFNNFGK
jgi:hypothetical protein